jgi:PTS system nitrogen regulatory IIA component
MTTLEQLISQERVVPRLRAADKTQAITELARRAVTGLALSPAAAVAALVGREALGSTGVGRGIAVPHARLAGLLVSVGAFGRLERPADWQAIDGQPVDLVFLLLSPETGGEHLAALAAVSRRLRDKAVAEAVRAAETAPAIRALLLSG